MTSLWMTVASLASTIARAAPGYRARGRDAAGFRIALSGIRATPQRPPRRAFAASFAGLALARRRGRGR